MTSSQQFAKLAAGQLRFLQTWVEQNHGVAFRGAGSRRRATLMQKEIPGVGKIELVATLYRDAVPSDLRGALDGSDDDD